MTTESRALVLVILQRNGYPLRGFTLQSAKRLRQTGVSIPREKQATGVTTNHCFRRPTNFLRQSPVKTVSFLCKRLIRPRVTQLQLRLTSYSGKTGRALSLTSISHLTRSQNRNGELDRNTPECVLRLQSQPINTGMRQHLSNLTILLRCTDRLISGHNRLLFPDPTSPFEEIPGTLRRDTDRWVQWLSCFEEASAFGNVPRPHQLW